MGRRRAALRAGKKPNPTPMALEKPTATRRMSGRSTSGSENSVDASTETETPKAMRYVETERARGKVVITV